MTCTVDHVCIRRHSAEQPCCAESPMQRGVFMMVASQCGAVFGGFLTVIMDPAKCAGVPSGDGVVRAVWP
jgi:hypothetical protein